MERKDLVYIAVALFIVLALALLGKPFLLREGNPLQKYIPVIESENNREPSFISPPPPPSPTYTPPPTTTLPYRIYAVLNGTEGGITESFTVPFSRWTLSIWAIPRLKTSDNSSFIFPRMRIQVADSENSSRIVQSFEPDLLDARINTSADPRPWKVEIPEGNRAYYIVVYTQSVESYTIEIMVQG